MYAHDYISGNVFPMKWLKQPLYRDRATDRFIPQHITFYPTNRCTRNCSWCSCGKEDRQTEMDIAEILQLFDMLSSIGTEAITLSGGGEPTLHRDFDHILSAGNKDYEFKLGLVTNGDLLLNNKLSNKTINDNVQWLRISLNDKQLEDIDHIACYIGNEFPEVDKSFSYVVTADSPIDLIKSACEALNKYNLISCIRLTEDAFNSTGQLMQDIEKHNNGIAKKVIYHYRDNFSKGGSPCYVSRLRPAIDAKGDVYPCPCVQYAIPGKEQCLPPETKMCHWTELAGADYFDGSICKKCFFANYNSALNYIASPTKHMEFV